MNRVQRVAGAALFLSMGVNTTVAVAQDCADYPAVSLQAITSEEINNDWVRLNWRVEVEEDESASAMKAANGAIDKAMAKIKRDQSIKNIKTNIQTYPVYGKDRSIKHWRAVGSLSFESSLTDLEKKNQVEFGHGLVLANLEYFASPEEREKSRARLLNQAMEEFQGKALLVAKGFNHSGYELARISVNDETRGMGQPPMMRAMSAMQESSMKVSDVAASGGSSAMTVSVNGEVCLKP